MQLIEAAGRNVCRTVKLTVKGIAAVAVRIASLTKSSAAPFIRSASAFLKGILIKPVEAVRSLIGHISESKSRFARRSKLFGARKAVGMQIKEDLLALRRKGSVAASVLNVLFPVAAAAFLVFTVSSAMSTKYGVAIEYDGEEIGVVSNEDTLTEAQAVVADRVKYYDTDGEYYVTAALTIKPLKASDDIIDENALAEKMEDRISSQFDEITESAEAVQEIAPEDIEGKIKAYSVTIDGELFGAVESYGKIEAALNEIKAPYLNSGYAEVGFDKNISYSEVYYADPAEMVSEKKVIDKLTGSESAPEYYEVQDGDTLWWIAEAKGMTLKELCSCYATYNGKVIEDIEHSILKSGTLIQIESDTPFLRVEYSEESVISTKIPFETIRIEDATLDKGTTVVETAGSDGEKSARVIITYREGTAVRKKTLESVITKDPVSAIVRVGTHEVNTINHNAPQFITEGGTGDYFWPVGGGYISAHQGDGRGHKGIDIAAPYGTPIYAAASGTVIDAATDWNGGYGNCIVIANDDGNETWYAHQSELAAVLGDHVEAGQLIGYVGSTGDSTGNHLHFEVRNDGKYYNPELYVTAP